MPIVYRAAPDLQTAPPVQEVPATSGASLLPMLSRSSLPAPVYALSSGCSGPPPSAYNICRSTPDHTAASVAEFAIRRTRRRRFASWQLAG